MRFYFAFALSVCLVSTITAAPITYDLVVDTSSISATAGSLDFEFNPGPLVSQLASLEVLNFSSNGTLAGSPALSGDVTGSLPGTLTFDNLGGLNDYFEGFTFGSMLSFEVSLSGPALSSPDGTSTSGSAFAFSMFSDSAGSIPVLTSDSVNGFAATIAVNLDGTTTPTNFSEESTITPEVVPEPAGAVFPSVVAMLLILSRPAWRRRLLA